MKTLINPRSSLALFSLFLLFACSSNPYRPLSSGIGFTETMIDQNTYEIMYHGSSKQDELVARNYAVARAAEIANREGYPFFRVENSLTKEKQEQRTYIESDPYYSYPGYYSGWGGSCYTYTRTETKPVIRITVNLDSSSCAGCLSTDKEIREAAAEGITNKDHAPSG